MVHLHPLSLNIAIWNLEYVCIPEDNTWIVHCFLIDSQGSGGGEGGESGNGWISMEKSVLASTMNICWKALMAGLPH